MARRKNRTGNDRPSWGYNDIPTDEEINEATDDDTPGSVWNERDIDAPWWSTDESEQANWYDLTYRRKDAPVDKAPAGAGKLLSARLDCHPTGNTLVYSTGNMRVYGSGSERGIEAIAGGIHLNLGPQFNWYTPAIAQVPRVIFPELLAWTEIPQEVKIVWPDMRVPRLSALFWQTLAHSLTERAQACGMLDVVVFCMGGHGRTGTALAILLGLWGISEPWSYIWKHYCQQAIETKSQEDYVQRMLGLI